MSRVKQDLQKIEFVLFGFGGMGFLLWLVGSSELAAIFIMMGALIVAWRIGVQRGLEWATQRWTKRTKAWQNEIINEVTLHEIQGDIIEDMPKNYLQEAKIIEVEVIKKKEAEIKNKTIEKELGMRNKSNKNIKEDLEKKYTNDDIVKKITIERMKNIFDIDPIGYFSDELPSFKEDTELELTLGVEIDRAGEIKNLFRKKLTVLGNILIVGVMGAGKSGMAVGMVEQILRMAESKDKPPITMHIIDLTNITFNSSLYEGVRPLCGGKIVTDIDEAQKVLVKIEGEIKKREKLFNKETNTYPESVGQYNMCEGVEKLPIIMVFIEEYPSVMRMMGKEFEEHFNTILFRARKYGIFFVALVQEADKKKFPSREMFHTKIWLREISKAMRLSVGYDKTIPLEYLPGRALVLNGGTTHKIQAPEVNKQNLVNFIKNSKEKQEKEKKIT